MQPSGEATSHEGLRLQRLPLQNSLSHSHSNTSASQHLRCPTSEQLLATPTILSRRHACQIAAQCNSLESVDLCSSGRQSHQLLPALGPQSASQLHCGMRCGTCRLCQRLAPEQAVTGADRQHADNDDDQLCPREASGPVHAPPAAARRPADGPREEGDQLRD